MNHRETGPFDISRSPIHLALPSTDAPNAIPIADFGFDREAFERYIARYCSSTDAGRLMMIESSATDWSAWECHARGDEVVFVLEGEAVFIQEMDGTERRFTVHAGDVVINPAGVWHPADIIAPVRAIYITPCPGTTHRVRERPATSRS